MLQPLYSFRSGVYFPFVRVSGAFEGVRNECSFKSGSWKLFEAAQEKPYNINLFLIFFFFFSVLLPFIVSSALPCQADLLCPIWHAFFFFQLTHNRFFKIWHHYKGPYLSVWYWKWYDSFYILEISLIFSKNSWFVFHFCGSFWFLHLNRLWQMLAFCCSSSYKMFVEIKRSVLDF